MDTNEEVNTELLQSIQIFMDDLSNITSNKNFNDFHTIVKRIDESKTKSYFILVSGFKNFFETNKDVLMANDFENLVEPTILYTSNNGTFSFNFYDVFKEAEPAEQEVIKDHLNLIWNFFENKEEKYLIHIIETMKFNSDNLNIVTLFSEFKQRNLNVSRFIKVSCNLIKKNLPDEQKDDMSVIIDKIERIDVNNINVTEITQLIQCLLDATQIFKSNLFSSSDLFTNILGNISGLQNAGNLSTSDEVNASYMLLQNMSMVLPNMTTLPNVTLETNGENTSGNNENNDKFNALMQFMCEDMKNLGMSVANKEEDKETGENN